MKKICVALFIMFSFCFSCKKSSTSSNTNAVISGYWFGTSSVGNKRQLFTTSGTTIEYDFYATSSTDTATCQYKGYGTYTVVGNKVSFNLTFPTVSNETFNEQGVVNTSVTPNTISGTYTGAGAGSFTIAKQ